MLKGKTALVTGSTSGIGLGIAKALAAQGANIVLNGFGDVDGPKAEVAALAAQRRTATDVKRIRQSIAQLNKAVLAGGDGVDEDVHYHRAIAEAARNPFLIGTLEYLGQFLQGATRVTRANEARRADFARQVGEEHAVIFKAIEAGDAPAARAAATLHMVNAIIRIGQADPAFWEQTGVELASTLVHGLPH